MNIRQIALVAADLAAVKETLFDVLGLEEAFIDEGVGQFGLQNIVMRIGETYLEVVSPIQEGTTAGRLLQRRGGDGGYMVIVQVDDLAAETARIEAAGITIAWRADLGKAKVIHLHPRDVPGAIASLDQMTPPEAWYWSGENWASQKRANNVSAITGAQIQSANPALTAGQWSVAYNRPLETVGGVRTMRLDNSEVRFVEATDGRGEGLQALDVTATDLEAVRSAADHLGLAMSGATLCMCGTRFNFAQEQA
jgi:hypothetical protein